MAAEVVESLVQKQRMLPILNQETNNQRSTWRTSQLN